MPSNDKMNIVSMNKKNVKAFNSIRKISQLTLYELKMMKMNEWIILAIFIIQGGPKV